MDLLLMFDTTLTLGTTNGRKGIGADLEATQVVELYPYLKGEVDG